MKKAVAAMFLAVLAAAAMATEYTWKSSVATGKWSDPANWTGGDGTSCPGDGDSVVFFNFRPDRARQLTRVFVNSDDELAEFAKRLAGLNQF